MAIGCRCQETFPFQTDEPSGHEVMKVGALCAGVCVCVSALLHVWVFACICVRLHGNETGFWVRVCRGEGSVMLRIMVSPNEIDYFGPNLNDSDGAKINS